MNEQLQHIYQYTNQDDWTDYAMTNMPKIEAQTHKENGLEIWLVAKRGVLGKWGMEINRGYIEEYRDEKRLAEESINYLSEEEEK